MREILFRGKETKSDNIWIYGSFIPLSNNNLVCAIKDDTLYRHVHLCDKNTVGQFTGLTDKNGKKIFEGDILKYCQQDGAKLNGKPIMCVGKVVYNNKTLSYAVEGKDEIGGKNYDYFPLKKEFEVIGNIYDNPELLGD